MTNLGLKTVTACLCFSLAVLLAACTPVADTPSAEISTLQPGAPSQQASVDLAGEPLEGSENFASEPFTLETATTLRIQWEQQTEDRFVLTIRNLNESTVESRYNLVVLELATQPSQGQKAYRLIAGDYVLEIEGPDSTWRVALESSGEIFQNQANAGEFARLAGELPGTSVPFELDGVSPISIEWEYTGEGQFQAAIIRIDPSLPYGEEEPIAIVNQAGSSRGKLNYALSAGSYIVDIQLASGPWEIVVTENQGSE